MRAVLDQLAVHGTTQFVADRVTAGRIDPLTVVGLSTRSRRHVVGMFWHHGAQRPRTQFKETPGPSKPGRARPGDSLRGSDHGPRPSPVAASKRRRI